MRKQQLIKRCKELGCLLLDNIDTVSVDAPVGYVFANTGAHSSTVYLTDNWKRPEAYRELMTALERGLEGCSDKDCDSCVHEPMTFEAIHKLYGGERLS